MALASKVGLIAINGAKFHCMNAYIAPINTGYPIAR
jgi:hypothetical protein